MILYMDIKKLFPDSLCFKNDRKYHEIFKNIKPLIVTQIQEALKTRSIKQTGRPITTDFNKFVDALFFLCESGSQSHFVKDVFGIPKATYYRYLKIIGEYQILQKVYNSMIDSVPVSEPLITVKSMRGSEGLGRSATDRGRKGLKVSLICDTKRIARIVHIGRANTHDSKLLIHTIEKFQTPKQTVKCLCDAGYVGQQLSCECMKKNLRLVVKPKRVGRSGKMSHYLNPEDEQDLKKYRNQIELLNGNIRRFRSLMIKWVVTIATYECCAFMYYWLSDIFELLKIN